MKLERVKLEQNLKCEGQVEKISRLFDTEQISLEEKNEKISLFRKIKNNKLTMIDCTKVLFHKILKEEPEGYPREEQIQNIMKSLNSFSSLEHLPSPEQGKPCLLEEEYQILSPPANCKKAS